MTIDSAVQRAYADLVALAREAGCTCREYRNLYVSRPANRGDGYGWATFEHEQGCPAIYVRGV